MIISTKTTPVHTHSFSPSILRAYDIRGVFEESLFPEDAEYIGKAFATAVIRATGKKQPRIMLGYDGRLSTPVLRERLIVGLTSTGATIGDIGIGPTPMLYFSVHHLAADAGVMITGSHNPGTHNGFKMMLGKHSFFADQIQELGAIAAIGDFETGRGSVSPEKVTDAYLAALLAGFEPDGGTPLKIAFDPGNGAAGEITQKLADYLPGDHVVINGEIDGSFPNHHPDPTVPAHMEQLITTVQKEHCDLGIAFDGDGDRIGAVDRQGRILYGDHLMMLFAHDVLTRHPGATIIADVKASQTLFDAVAAQGGTPLMWKTGHSLIKEKMKETGAKLAGEMSGHIFFADRYFGYDDGLYAAVRLANLLAHGTQTLDAWMDAMPRIFNTPEIRINTPEVRKFMIIEEIRNRLHAIGAEMSEVDGVRVRTADGWWLARASNTQPAIIVRAESNSAKGLENLKKQMNDQLFASGVAV